MWGGALLFFDCHQEYTMSTPQLPPVFSPVTHPVIHGCDVMGRRCQAQGTKRACYLVTVFPYKPAVVSDASPANENKHREAGAKEGRGKGGTNVSDSSVYNMVKKKMSKHTFYLVKKS